jgi:betaine reductase
MDLENQKRIKDFATEYGPENLVVILGAAEAEASGLAAETVTMGDPTFSGVLANEALGLTTFHVLEDQFKSAVNADVFEEQVGMMEMVLEVEEIVEEMNEIRGEGCKYL